MTIHDAKPMTLSIYTDGGARGNPGPGASAFVAKDTLGKDVAHGSIYLGFTTNNVAEYQGVILALEWLSKNKNLVANQQIINFYIDSQLIMSQLNLLYKIKDEKLKTLFQKAKTIQSEIPTQITYNLIPREKNADADALVNQTLDLHLL